jgi:hypothetical protein
MRYERMNYAGDAFESQSNLMRFNSGIDGSSLNQGNQDWYTRFATQK